LDLLNRHPDLRGIYVAGGGMEGAIQAMREATEPGQVSLIVNELTAESRAGLLDGYVTMVIGTPLRRLCIDLIELMISDSDGIADDTVGQHFLEPRIILPEMM
jgi:LacI family transcriptional regulator